MNDSDDPKRVQLNRIEEAVVLGLQKLKEITGNEELFARSTQSGVCSSKSVGCTINEKLTTG